MKDKSEAMVAKLSGAVSMIYCFRLPRSSKVLGLQRWVNAESRSKSKSTSGLNALSSMIIKVSSTKRISLLFSMPLNCPGAAELAGGARRGFGQREGQGRFTVHT